MAKPKDREGDADKFRRDISTLRSARSMSSKTSRATSTSRMLVKKRHCQDSKRLRPVALSISRR